MTAYCYRCMRVEVGSVGESCDACLAKKRHRPSDASDMSLEELIATQKSGYVPGVAYMEKKELPRGFIHEDGWFMP